MTVATFARLPAPTPMRRAWAAIAPVDAYLRRRGFDGPRPLVTSPLLLELVAVRQAPEEPWQPLDPPFELVQTQNSNGIRVLYGSARQKATAPPTRLASAIYRLRLAGPGYQNAEHPLDLLSASDMPPALLELDLLPGPDYPFPPGNTVPGLRWPTLLRGGVLRSDGRGWPGVTVSALGYVEPDGLGSAVTCDDGQWVLPFVDGQPMLEPVSVELRWPAEDGRPPVVLEVNIAQGKTNVLAPNVVHRGWNPSKTEPATLYVVRIKPKAAPLATIVPAPAETAGAPAASEYPEDE